MAIKVYVNSIKAELMCNLSNISKILEDTGKLKFMFFVFSIYQKPSSNVFINNSLKYNILSINKTLTHPRHSSSCSKKTFSLYFI